MLGYEEKELRVLTWPEFTYPPDLPQDLNAFGRLCAGEIDKYSLRKRFIRKQGDLIETVISVTCLRKPNGHADSVVGLVEAIRARQQPEKSLQQFVKELSKGLGSNAEVLPIIQRTQRDTEPYRAVGDVPPHQLFRPGQVTKRELNVLTLLAEGLSHKAVAETLQISVRTVDGHARNIMRKVGLRNITDLIRFALRNEIISK
jgi:PAS domain S-box-containing protein